MAKRVDLVLSVCPETTSDVISENSDCSAMVKRDAPILSARPVTARYAIFELSASPGTAAEAIVNLSVHYVPALPASTLVVSCYTLMVFSVLVG